jgi:hypothetical protein
MPLRRPEFETWIKQQPGTRLDAASIAKLNDSIRGYHHDEGTVQAVLGENDRRTPGFAMR